MIDNAHINFIMQKLRYQPVLAFLWKKLTATDELIGLVSK